MNLPIELITINRLHIADADGTAIATIAPNGTAQAAAEHIVKCVNHHDELVAALDTHILKFMSEKGYKVPKSTPSKKTLCIDQSEI